MAVLGVKKKARPHAIKACRIKANPSGGLRTALTRLHGKTENTDHVRHPASSFIQSDEVPNRNNTNST